MGALFGQDVAAPPLRNVVEKGRQLEVYKSVLHRWLLIYVGMTAWLREDRGAEGG